MKDNKSSKLALSVALVFLGGMLLFGNQKATTDSFASEPISFSGFNKQEGALPERVLIPSVGIDLSVSEAKIVNGYWEVFEDKAAWGEDSGLPGIPGNQVIFAHAREGLFLPLKNVKRSEKIYVFTNENWFSYEVKEIKEVYPDQKEVIEPTEDETLTLYTCSGFNDSKRLIVIAKRV